MNNLIQRRIVSLLLITVLVVCSSAVAYADNPADSEEFVHSDEHIDFDELDGELDSEEAQIMDDFVKEYESKLDFSTDGINDNDVNKRYFTEKYGEDLVKMASDGIKEINEQIDEGELEITENGTLYEAEDEDLYVQGSYNKTSGTTYWWGRLIKESYTKANTHKKNLKACKSIVDVIAKVTTLGGILGKNALFTGEGIAAIGISDYTSKFIKRIGACNKANIGIKYKIYWTCNYVMRAQNKSF